MKEDKNLPSSFIEFDTEKDDIIILRVPEPPQEGGAPPPETDEPQEPQETPENVENPFDEEQPKPENEDDKNGDAENKDGEDKEPKEGEDKEPKDGQDKEPKENKKEGEGDEGDEGDEEGEGEEGDFGNTDNEKIDLDELLKKVKDAFEKGNSTQNIQNEMDLQVVERALATSKNNIKDVFKTKAIAKAAIGNRNLFGADNEQKINDVLNEIFK
jgi:hypothetical protein